MHLKSYCTDSLLLNLHSQSTAYRGALRLVPSPQRASAPAFAVLTFLSFASLWTVSVALSHRCTKSFDLHVGKILSLIEVASFVGVYRTVHESCHCAAAGSDRPFAVPPTLVYTPPPFSPEDVYQILVNPPHLSPHANLTSTPPPPLPSPPPPHLLSTPPSRLSCSLPSPTT